MAWTPTDRDRLQCRIESGLEAGGDDLRAWFARISREPAKWRLCPWGDAGGGFWVVAVVGNRAVWWNDIEEGFQVSAFTEEGVIPTAEYRCNQDDLDQALRALIAAGGPAVGPPRPVDP